jgi:ADP-ribosylglycohydrolase
VSFCADAAAAVAAAVAIAVVPGASLDQVLGAAPTTLHPRYGVVMRDLINEALALARRSQDYETFRRGFHRRFRQPVACDSRETVPAVFGLVALADGDPQRCVESAANFGRDTDTIGAMAGSISGALAGARSLPTTWTTAFGPQRLESERQMSARLASLAIAKAVDQRILATATLAHLTA